ncbi:LamG domain-containing protein [Streptomyces sp. SID14478]|uniref:LamG domain-containing protein n=1 Tax=Streptomyces sp. SID14478 TaxID=2706073 RepID=UPI0013D9E163|nr:LamG domain-containing protein [Streptomyces sp. SID14478]NEB75403.1 LamG domain-containing protein [Streptomyces sp. SID14478]
MKRHVLRRSAVAAVLASAAVVAVPWSAEAAANQPPAQPVLSDLNTDGHACAAGSDRPFVGNRPTLRAVLRDPDAEPGVAEPLTAQFEVSWTDGAGEPQVRTITQDAAKASGSQFSAEVPADMPAFTEVSWRVRAFDGESWGPWSSAGGQHTCEFVYDNKAPAEPTVTSDDYPDDDVWHNGAGRYGTFSVDSASDDTVAYVYNFLGEAQHTVRPDEPGGPVRLTWLPDEAGVEMLSVRALDRAGNASGTTNYTFRVSSGAQAVAAWRLADAAGSREAAADQGDRAATAGGGVTFGASGPERTSVTGAAELDGTPAAYLTSGAPAVAPDKAFSVSAWVRPDSVDTDRAVLSQDGSSTAAFRLGTTVDADGARVWSFGLGEPGAVVRAQGGRPEAGEWAHLVGVYDPVARTAKLYVNGQQVATAAGAEGPTASGDLQLGRALGPDGQGENWEGAIAGVQVWDRIVSDEEAALTARRAPVSKGYWALDEASGGESPERDGGPALALGGDASVHVSDDSCALDPDCVPGEEPIIGSGDLRLDGDGDFAATRGPVVDTSDSFSIAMHVELDEAAQDRSMTVFSLPGEHHTLVSVGYSAETQRWQATVADADEDGARTTTLTAEQASVSDGYPQHLAFVYDDETDQVRLYVDGQLADQASYTGAWRTAGGLQLGRTVTADGWGGYLKGVLDDAHAYAGVLRAEQIRLLSIGATDV